MYPDFTLFNRQVEQDEWHRAHMYKRFKVVRPNVAHSGQVVECSAIRFTNVLPILDCHPPDDPEDWRSYTPFDLLPEPPPLIAGD